MNKITDHINKRQTLSAQDQYDEGVNGGYSPEDLDEAVLIEREIQDIPDKEEWEPTEEKFQMLLSKAKELGFITEREASDAREDGRINAYDEEKIIPKPKRNRKQNIQNIRKGVIKWSAAAAIAIIGIFGAAMSSEANRAYIMEKVNTMLNSEVKTKANNVEVLESNAGEGAAREEIEAIFGMKMPTFFYMPEEMQYESHVIVEEAQTASIQYLYGNKAVYLTVVSNEKEAANTMQSDKGNEIETIKSDLEKGLTSTLYEIKDEGDIETTYILQWKFKNIYYEIFGKVPQEEFFNIAKNIVY